MKKSLNIVGLERRRLLLPSGSEVEMKKSVSPFKKFTNKELMAELGKRGIFSSKMPPAKSGLSFKANVKRWAGSSYRFGVISCTQIGSKFQQLTALHQFYELCRKEGIDTVLHCGDLVDGSKVYRGQEYELFAHGADAQADYTVKHYPKKSGITTHVIAGNHDMSFWKTDGTNIVRRICDQRPDMVYEGDYFAHTTIGGLKIAIMHGTGGVAYARSYKLQKIVEQLAPENKPHFLFVGHWHVPAMIPAYRNVEAFSMGCFQSQTPFLTTLGLMPVISGLIVEFKTDKHGLASVQYRWIPFYKPIKDDF